MAIQRVPALRPPILTRHALASQRVPTLRAPIDVSSASQLPLLRVCERYQENTVQLLNRNNKQTIGVVNKQKTNSWVLNKQLAWSSHRGLQKPFLMSVWTKFGYLSAPVMTIIHKKTKKLPQKAKKRRFTFSKQRRKFLTTFPLRRLCAAPANFCPKPHHFTKNGQKNTVRTENKHSCL